MYCNLMCMYCKGVLSRVSISGFAYCRTSEKTAGNPKNYPVIRNLSARLEIIR